VDFATALRQRRCAHRVSQLELAIKADTTQRHLSFIESGRSAPGRGMVIRLAEVNACLQRRIPTLHCTYDHAAARPR
jgi:transcriptional regulator with XRE-family HTH domain